MKDDNQNLFGENKLQTAEIESLRSMVRKLEKKLQKYYVAGTKK